MDGELPVIATVSTTVVQFHLNFVRLSDPRQGLLSSGQGLPARDVLRGDLCY
jgi:hypothetical protein